jgi:hypothetical protein
VSGSESSSASKAAEEVCKHVASGAQDTFVYRAAVFFNVVLHKASAEASPPAYLTCVLALPHLSLEKGVDIPALVAQVHADMARRGSLEEAQLVQVQTGMLVRSADMLAVTFKMSCLATTPVRTPPEAAAHICASFAAQGFVNRQTSMYSASLWSGSFTTQQAFSVAMSSSVNGDKMPAEGAQDVGMILSVSFCTKNEPSVLPGLSVRARVACCSNLYEFIQERAYLKSHVVPLLKEKMARLGAEFSWRQMTWHSDERDKASQHRMQVRISGIPVVCT